MKRIVIYFLTWKIFIFIFLVFSLATLPLQFDFLGGSINSYLNNPYVWSFVNFDGTHYLSIVIDGYKPLTYFYFPFFPMLVRLVSNILGSGSIIQTVNIGIWLNNLFFITALAGLYKLVIIDYTRKIAYLTVILLLLFPTSFYFSAFYNESLFLALTIWCFYFARSRKWIAAGALGILASATRVVGIALLPALIIEVFLQKRNGDKKIIIPFLSAISVLIGLFVYIIYLYFKTGDPLEFVNSVGIFGQQRSSSLVFLPQVFYRYIFKVLPNINYDYFPIVLSTFLEIFSAVAFTFLVIFSFVRLRLSYAVYAAIAFLIPTLSGSFSSLPRYVLVLFPAFLLSAVFLEKANKLVKALIFIVLTISLTITAALFFRGFWVS